MDAKGCFYAAGGRGGGGVGKQKNFCMAGMQKPCRNQKSKIPAQ